MTGFNAYHAVVLLTPAAQFWRGIQVFPMESVCVSVGLCREKSAAIITSKVAPVVLIAGDVAVAVPDADADVWASRTGPPETADVIVKVTGLVMPAAGDPREAPSVAADQSVRSAPATEG